MRANIRLERRAGAEPERVTLRIPHPEGKKAISVVGGSYDPAAETVTLNRFEENAQVELIF